jgi:hypothetical protein
MQTHLVTLLCGHGVRDVLEQQRHGGEGEGVRRDPEDVMTAGSRLHEETTTKRRDTMQLMETRAPAESSAEGVENHSRGGGGAEGRVGKGGP